MGGTLLWTIDHQPMARVRPAVLMTCLAVQQRRAPWTFRRKQIYRIHLQYWVLQIKTPRPLTPLGCPAQVNPNMVPSFCTADSSFSALNCLLAHLLTFLSGLDLYPSSMDDGVYDRKRSALHKLNLNCRGHGLHCCNSVSLAQDACILPDDSLCGVSDPLLCLSSGTPKPSGHLPLALQRKAATDPFASISSVGSGPKSQPLNELRSTPAHQSQDPFASSNNTPAQTGTASLSLEGLWREQSAVSNSQHTSLVSVHVCILGGPGFLVFWSYGPSGPPSQRMLLWSCDYLCRDGFGTRFL